MNKSVFSALYTYLSDLSIIHVDELVFRDKFHLLVFLILSSRAKEKVAYDLSKKLISKYSTIESFIKVDLIEIRKIIKSIGFYKVKSERLIAFVNIVKTSYNLKFIKSYKDLLKIPGIGDKGAKKFLTLTSKVEFFLMDTHVKRVLLRLGFNDKNIKEICFGNRFNLNISDITFFSNNISNFGKKICTYKKPRCFTCKMEKICQFSLIER
ncbi:MAG: endonuclease III domain-containing protein [Thermodesulfobacteriota bacterium]|nr:MAG: hypothetical protein EVA30_00855 [Candidatus Dadabacteria bacterium]